MKTNVKRVIEAGSTAGCRPLVLPLGPPGKGAGHKQAPEPDVGAFRAAVARKQEPPPKPSLELDRASLEALLERDDSLTEWELDAFPSMLERLEESGHELSKAQRLAVTSALERLMIDPRDFELEPDELPGMR